MWDLCFALSESLSKVTRRRLERWIMIFLFTSNIFHHVETRKLDFIWSVYRLKRQEYVEKYSYFSINVNKSSVFLFISVCGRDVFNVFCFVLKACSILSRWTVRYVSKMMKQSKTQICFYRNHFFSVKNMIYYFLLF